MKLLVLTNLKQKVKSALNYVTDFEVAVANSSIPAAVPSRLS